MPSTAGSGTRSTEFRRFTIEALLLGGDEQLMFSLDYAPDIDPVTLERLEQVGRDVGLSLGQIELLGQSQEMAVEFIVSAVHGELDAFMMRVNWHELEDQLERRLLQT